MTLAQFCQNSLSYFQDTFVSTQHCETFEHFYLNPPLLNVRHRPSFWGLNLLAPDFLKFSLQISKEFPEIDPPFHEIAVSLVPYYIQIFQLIFASSQQDPLTHLVTPSPCSRCSSQPLPPPLHEQCRSQLDTVPLTLYLLTNSECPACLCHPWVWGFWACPPFGFGQPS